MTNLGHHTSGPRPRNRPSISALPSTPSRQRSRTPGSVSGSASGTAYWPLPTPQTFEPANEWGSDLVSQNLPFPVDAAGVGSAPNPSLFSDENLLNALAENEFSSPSTYPSFTNLLQPRPSSDLDSSQSLRLLQASASSSASSGLANVAASSGTVGPPPPSLRSIHPSAYDEHTLPTSSRIYNHTFNQLFDGNSQNTSQHTTLSNDILNEEELLVPATPDTIDSDIMPSTRMRTRAAHSAAGDDLPRAKRRRTSRASDLRRSPRFSHAATIATSGGAHNESSLFCDTDDDLFGESPTRPTGGLDLGAGDLTTIDLTEATEVPEELKKPDVDKRIKLGAFQCVICMDDVTTLTLTHCGHLYCAQCLHSSLNVEATRGKCPMCRTKIDMKPREAYSAKTKGFWPLELKLMTATRKGKRKADTLS